MLFRSISSFASKTSGTIKTKNYNVKRVSLIQVQKGIPIKLLPGVLSPCQVRFASHPRPRAAFPLSPVPLSASTSTTAKVLLHAPCTNFSLMCKYARLPPCSFSPLPSSLVLPCLASSGAKKKREMQNVNPENKEFADYTVS